MFRIAVPVVAVTLGLAASARAFGAPARDGADARNSEILVSAAASVSDALKEVGAEWGRRGGGRLVFNFGASSELGRQIREGAPADVFFSADEETVRSLERSGLVLPGSARVLLGNTLVVVAAADSRLTLASARELAEARVRSIALAEPATVPAGIYAKAYLTRLGVFDAISGKIVPTANVRAALAAVESGDVDAGIVYATDARISKKVRVVLEVPEAEGPAIRYVAAVVRTSRQPERAKRFLEFLGTDPARGVFARFGFLLRSGTN